MDDITESGDRVSAAFEEHWPAVRGHALRLVRDSAAAEDLAQEAFARLWAAHRDDRWPDVPRAWLTVVVSNLAVSTTRRAAVARRRGVDLSHLEMARLSRPGGPVEAAERAAVRASLMTALDALSVEKRRAILLAGAGYSADEIGQQIGRSASATRTLLCRARQSVRASIQHAL